MAKQRYAIVDADVHHFFASPRALDEYLPAKYRSSVVESPAYPSGPPVPNPNGGFRHDAVTPDGGVPGSDPAFMAEQLLDAYDIDYAVLHSGSLIPVSGMHDLDHAAAIARATNEWTIAEWLPVDDRYLGTIHISTSDPVQAAAEIRRLGAEPRIVQVGATGAFPCMMGDPFLHPIYEACEEVGLPLAVHPPLRGPQTARPTTFLEHHIDMSFPILPHLVSTVVEGVFEKYPRFMLILAEWGTSWLPFVMWRFDMEYRAARDEVPWLRRRPSEYIRDHVRLTTQPLEEPDDPQDLVKVLSTFDAEHMLLFSSDYPHWDFDNPERALRGFPEPWKERIFGENARELYRLAERVPAVA